MKNHVGFFILFLFISSIVLAGETIFNKNLPFVKTPTSPTAAAFQLYGDIPVSMYTGIPDISIPLYTIEVGEFKMPISLSYHPAGVRVESEASWVGLGWNLNVGGCITREIRGFDDFQTQNGHYERYSNGSVDGSYRIPIPSSTYSPNFSGFFKYAEYSWKRELKIDSEPDLFTYNFLGYNGRFVIKEGSNGIVLEKPEDNIKMTIEKTYTGGITITATLPTGDKLYFEKYEKCQTYQSAYDINNSGAVHNPSYISSWFLTRIETAAKYNMQFEYKEEYRIQGNVYKSQVITEPSGPSNLLPLIGINQELDPNDDRSCPGFSSLIDVSGRQMDNELYLNKIIFNGNTIEFITFDRSDYGTNSGSKRLNEMTVKDSNNRTIKVFKFDYDYFSSNFSGSNENKLRLCLNSIYETKNSTKLPGYIFSYDYNSNRNLPLKTSLSCDVWGYYNGSTGTSEDERFLLPPIVSKNNKRYFDYENPSIGGGFVQNGRDVKCNPNFITIGMLNKITYPTGGFAEFTFEPNRYQSLLQNVEKQGGGVRISKIKTDASERTFTYTNGVLLVDPVFCYQISRSAKNCTQYIYTSRSAVQLQGNKFGNYVGYDKVTETITGDGQTSVIINYFHNERELNAKNTLYTKNENGRNGLLIKKETYLDELLMNKTEYEYEISDYMGYNHPPNQQAMKFDDGMFYFYKVFPPHLFLGKEINANYYGSKAITDTTYYDRNLSNFLVNKTKVLRNQKMNVTEILYPVDINADIYKSMRNENRIKPIEETEYIRTDGGIKAVRSKLTLYNNNFFPEAIYLLETLTPISNFTKFNGTQKDSRYSAFPEIQSKNSDTEEDGEFMTIRETTNRAGISTAYIWGYGGQYIVAQIVNATIEEVISKWSGCESLKGKNDLSETDLQNLNTLRQKLPNAEVTIYTYRPLVGVASITDPKGCTVYYEYDDFNRLAKIKDSFGSTIEQYDYHVKIQ